MKHKWITKEDVNEIDNFAMSYEYHNGPICERCGYSFCEHCSDHWDDDDCPGYTSSDQEEYW